ncbi:hypothetical protein V8F33_006341 [Rhypophila sp. PSN 637]
MSSESKEGITALCGSLLGLTSLSVGLRFYVRKRQRAPIMLDDLCAVASLAGFIGAAATSIHMVQHRIIGHPGSPEIAGEYSAKLQIAWDVLTLTALSFSKLSALFFYRRIFYLGGGQSHLNIVVLITAAIIVVWMTIFQFLTGFQCGTHFTALWDGTYLEYCTISFPFLIGLAISDFLLDVWIVSIPIPSVLRLNAPWPKKLAVLGVFLLSLVCVYASANRVAVFAPLIKAGPEYLINFDYERAISNVVFYVDMEAGISLLVVNLPTLWFLGTLIKPHIRTLSSKLSQTRLLGSRSGNSTGASKTAVGEVRSPVHAGFETTPSMQSDKTPSKTDIITSWDEELEIGHRTVGK